MNSRWLKLVSFWLFTTMLVLLSLRFLMLWATQSTTSARYLPTPRPVEVCDVCEPNNRLSQACGPLTPGLGYQFFISCTSNASMRDQDLFYLDLETPGVFTVDLTDIPADGNYGVYLYDADSNRVNECSSNAPGNADEHASCVLSQLGRYYVQVYPFEGCNDSDPYSLTVAYATPPPTPIPTATPTPICNLHIDDFGDTDPHNDLRQLSGWELDPPGCGTFEAHYTGHELQLDYDLTSPSGCTARYTTTLLLNASPHELLTFKLKGAAAQVLTSTVVGLSDEAEHEMRVKVGDFLNQVVTDTWQGVVLPLAAFDSAVNTTQLDSLFVEFADTQGASQGTVYLDNLRLERPLVPLTVNNFNDLVDPNALGGGSGIYKDENPGTILEAAYTTADTYDNSPGSYVISYTLPSDGWALWETYLLGLDVSDYTYLSFYIKGANGGEKVNLYFADGDGRVAYVDMEAYTSIVTGWLPVRVPLQAFEGVDLTDLDKIKFTFEWEPMTGTVFLDDLRFVADTLLVDSFCDSDESNSFNGEMGTFTSSPFCTATVTSTFSYGALRLDYDVTAGPGCFSGYWSRTPVDLNPYRSLKVNVRGEMCGEIAAISARTVSVATDKLKLSDYLLDGITDQWQEARIPLVASSAVTDWTRGDSYVIAFEENQGAFKGTTWWDDVAFETTCAPLWVDNFNDGDSFNALRGWSYDFEWNAEMTSSISIAQAYGDGGAGLVLTYAVPGDDEYAGWLTELRNVDLSNYDRLVFNIKGAAGGETPNIYLRDDDGYPEFVNIEDYAPLSTEWQTAAVPLQNFGDLDLTRILSFEVIIEEEEYGTLFLDNIRFLPAADCSQVTSNVVFLPKVSKNYVPLALDPIWDFESDTEGWRTYETITTSRAVIDVMTSTFRSRWGNASLALPMTLEGNDDRLDRGVAYVDLPETDLACKPLSCWIYVPTCGLGDPDEPTSARLFVKDANDKDEYGTKRTVLRDQWYKIELRPSTVTPPEGYMEPGFDPHRIIRVGVQVRTDSPKTVYHGKIFVDACGWEEIDPELASVETCLPVADTE